MYFLIMYGIIETQLVNFYFDLTDEVQKCEFWRRIDKQIKDNQEEIFKVRFVSEKRFKTQTKNTNQ